VKVSSDHEKDPPVRDETERPELRLLVMKSVQAPIRALPRDDRLLTVEEVCQVLNVTEQWVYHNANKLPFVRKVGSLLRFSSNGLQRYIESKKFTVRGY
jgi:excisionase family DNA binding protein